MILENIIKKISGIHKYLTNVHYFKTLKVNLRHLDACDDIFML